ncbi:MAG: hypothetical protein WC683_09600 [bacterium]
MPSKRELQEAHQAEIETLAESYGVEYANLTERIASLELALEDTGWFQLSMEGDSQFSRAGLRKIAKLARIFYLKNPLIQRGVEVQAFYVFGQGVTISAEAAPVNEVIQRFVTSRRNQAELFGHQQMLAKEIDLQVEGNQFFCLFTNQANGDVTVRTIPPGEVNRIIKNPDDRRETWFYERTYNRSGFNPYSGADMSQLVTEYYPDIGYEPEERLESIGGKPIYWDRPVYQVKETGLSDMDFAVPAVYSALDWARAYKDFLSDWSTIVRAYAKFAWALTTKGGTAGVAAGKAKLDTTLGTSSGETNPPPLTASTFISTEGVKLDAVRTGGATTSAQDGRRLLLMVAAAVGLPETFFGDVSVGTLATAKSLDRPTELKFVSRQKLWASVFSTLCGYAIVQAVKYGDLDGHLVYSEDDEDEPPGVELGPDPETGEDMRAEVTCDFPPILEHDPDDAIKAIISAATLDGKAPAGTIPDLKTLSRMLLIALDVENIDQLLDDMFPEGEPGEAEQQMVAAVTEMRDVLADVRRALSAD